MNNSPDSNWKSNNDGLNITNISSEILLSNTASNTTGIIFYIYPSNVELFIQSLIGKVSTGIRTFNSTIEKSSILLNNDLETSFIDIHGDLVNLKLEQNLEIANKIGISGTPAYVIENELISGFVGKGMLKSLLKKK